MLASLILTVTMSALCPQKVQDPAALVPADTIMYFGTQSLRAAARAGRTSAMHLILNEPEVKAFLQKPVAAADSALQEMVKATDLGEAGAAKISLSELVSGSEEGPALGRMYLALTHVNLAVSGGDKPAFPDVGLVVGVELLNGDDVGLLKSLWSQIPLAEESANYHGHDYFVKSQPDKGYSISLVFLGTTAIASTSDKSLHDAMDRFDGKAPAGSSLAESAEYRKLIATAGSFPDDASSMLLRMPPLVDLLRGFLSSGQLDSPELAALAPKIVTALDGIGLKALKSVGGISFRDASGKIQSTSVVSLDASVKGLVSRCVAASKPVDTARIKGVPGNTLSMFMTSIDGIVEVYDYLLSTFAALAPDEYAQFQGILKELMGDRDLRNDIVANVHGTLLGYSLPGEGFPGTPTEILRMGLNDPPSFVAGVKALFKGASDMFSPGNPATVNESMHETFPFYELDLSHTMAAAVVPQPPAFAVDGKELVVSLQSAKTLRSVLNGTAGEGSLGDNAEFMDFVNGLAKQGEVRNVSYSDNAKSFGAAYGQLAGAAQMFGGGMSNLPVDLALMPPEAAISKHLGHSYDGTVSEDGGATVVTRSVQQFELGDFIPLLITGGVIAATSMGDEGGASAPPRAMEPAEQAQEDLRQISAGMTIYKIAQGSYPAAIDDLVKPLEDWPDGCIGKKEVPVDPWGNAYHFRLNEKKKPFLWSSGPDGVDQDGGGDDIVKH